MASTTMVPEVGDWFAGMVSVVVEVAPLTVLVEKLPVIVLDLSKVNTIALFDAPPVAWMESVAPAAM